MNRNEKIFKLLLYPLKNRNLPLLFFKNLHLKKERQVMFKQTPEKVFIPRTFFLFLQHSSSVKLHA